MVGIYKITNPKGRVYIGQSKDINQRWKQYFSFNKESNTQPKLYNSFKKYGVVNHKFEIVTECDINQLNELERYYQEIYNALNNGLNCMLTKTDTQNSVGGGRKTKYLGEIVVITRRVPKECIKLIDAEIKRICIDVINK